MCQKEDSLLEGQYKILFQKIYYSSSDAQKIPSKLKQEAALGRKHSLANKMMGAGNDNQASEDTKEKEMLEKSQKEDYHFHAWVYVDMVESSGFFIEATSGQ